MADVSNNRTKQAVTAVVACAVVAVGMLSQREWRAGSEGNLNTGGVSTATLYDELPKQYHHMTELETVPQNYNFGTADGVKKDGHGRELSLDFDGFRIDATAECEIQPLDGSAAIPCRNPATESAQLTAFIDRLVVQLEETFEERLQVRPVEGNLMAGGFSAQCQISGIGSFKYLNTEFTDTDFVLFYSVTDEGCGCTGTGSGTLAYAAPCQVDQLGRPVVGIANFCSCQLAGLDPVADYDMWFYTFVHEVTHALVFSPSLYDDFIVEDPGCGAESNLPTGWCKYTSTPNQLSVTTTDTNDRAQTLTYIRTPKVTAWARGHYACDTMIGMELENQGGAGTTGSHWETRLTHNEYMTGAIKLRPSISALTLALFDDSGWYKAESSFAENFLWGKDAGCAFVEDTCIDTSTGAVVAGGEAEFCLESQTSPSKCSHDHRSISYCAAGVYQSDLPTQFQYFDNPRMGGAIQLYDYCPVIVEFSNGLCSNNANKQNGGYNSGQIFDANSICVSSTVATEASGQNAVSDAHGRCYQRECSVNAETGSLELRIYFTDSSDYAPLSQYAVCPFEGGVIDPSVFVSALVSGSMIVCPPHNEVCFGECPDQCNFHGNCVNDVCVCQPEYTGVACQTDKCPAQCTVPQGTCNLETAMCQCEDGFYGADCSLVECVDDASDDASCGESNTCSFNLTYPEQPRQCVCSEGFTGIGCDTLDCPGEIDCSGYGSCSKNSDATAVVCNCDEGFTGTDCGTLAPMANGTSSLAFLESCLDDCGRDGTCANSVRSLEIPTCFCDSDGLSWGPSCSEPEPPMVVYVNVTFHGKLTDFTQDHQARWREALGNYLVLNPQRIGLLRAKVVNNPDLDSFTVESITYPSDASRLENPEDPLVQVGYPSSYEGLNQAYEDILTVNELACPWVASNPSASLACLVSGTVDTNTAVQPQLTSAAVEVTSSSTGVCLPGLDLCNYKLAAVVAVVICFLSIVYGVRYSYYDEAYSNYKEELDDEARYSTARWSSAGPPANLQQTSPRQRINQV